MTLTLGEPCGPVCRAGESGIEPGLDPCDRAGDPSARTLLCIAVGAIRLCGAVMQGLFP